MIFQSRLLTEKGFAHAFPSRHETPEDVARALDVPRIEQVRQVHGARTVVAPCGEGVEADAIVGRAGGGRIAVGVRVADCVPVLMGHEDSGDVVAIHAGWRGIVSSVLQSGLHSLGPGRVAVAIGPCIGPCCFEVGADVAGEIAKASSDAVVHRREDGRITVDMRWAVRLQLDALGVESDNIENVPGCTRHEADLFHSFRRDGVGSGRMLAAIVTSR